MVLSGITSQTPQRYISEFQWTRTSLKAICTLNPSAAYLHNVSGKVSEVTHNQTNMASLLLSQMEKDSYYKELAKIKIRLLQRCMNLIFNFPKSKKFKKSSSCLSSEHRIGNRPVLLGICKISQPSFTK